MPVSDHNHQTERQSNSPLSDTQRDLIQLAVSNGIERYIQSRKAKVPEFVQKHFSFRGALKLHRKALGKDLYKAPLNVLWLAPFALIRVGSAILKKLGLTRFSRLLYRLPTGFETDLQKEVNWLIYTELLELPYIQSDRTSTKDALLEAILQDEKLADLLDRYLIEIQKRSTEKDFRQSLEKNLLEYAASRSSAAELAGNLLTLCTTYAAFHQAMPGVLTAGSATAAAIAQNTAITQFWLGPTLGAWYYALFPAAASTGLVISTVGTLTVGLGLLTTFIGIITDPLQAKLGLHQKRLLKFLDALEQKIRRKGEKQYAIKDIYVSRVFDIVDLLLVVLRS